MHLIFSGNLLPCTVLLDRLGHGILQSLERSPWNALSALLSGHYYILNSHIDFSFPLPAKSSRLCWQSKAHALLFQALFKGRALRQLFMPGFVEKAGWGCCKISADHLSIPGQCRQIRIMQDRDSWSWLGEMCRLFFIFFFMVRQGSRMKFQSSGSLVFSLQTGIVFPHPLL